MDAATTMQTCSERPSKLGSNPSRKSVNRRNITRARCFTMITRGLDGSLQVVCNCKCFSTHLENCRITNVRKEPKQDRERITVER